MPRGMVGERGLMEIATNTAGVTVSVAEEFTVPEVMPIVVLPVASVLASPFDPDALLMVATVAAVELQCPD